jgi:hypothetical protein
VTEIVCLDGPLTAPLVDRLAAVYRAAFAPAPFHETDVEAGWFAQELATELELGGFRCCAARRGEDLGGFAYGFDTPPTLPTDGGYTPASSTPSVRRPSSARCSGRIEALKLCAEASP